MYDYHTHSSFSHDSITPMNEIIEAAIYKGLKEIAITDHYDPDCPESNYSTEIDIIGYNKELSSAAEVYKDRIKVVKGLEIGIQYGAIQKCENTANAFPYDFIIGSFHAAYGADIYTRYFIGREQTEAFYDFYLYMADCLNKFKNFDVVGHFNGLDRYTDYVPGYAPFMGIIENILKNLIENGKGLEFNTANTRFGMGERTTPSKEILSLYKRLGGEIITIGSDAHRIRDIGYGYQTAVETLKKHGFKYVSTFKDRNINFVKI